MRPPDTVRARAATDPTPTARCARDVLEVVPAAMDALRAAMRSHVGGQLSVPQFRALHFVGRQPGCTVGEVAAFLGVTMPTASALVDRLARAGLLQPGTDPDDRRRARLTLSPPGRAQLTEIARGAHAELAAALDACSADELRDLQSGLAVLRRLFAAAATSAAAAPAPAAASTGRAAPARAPDLAPSTAVRRSRPTPSSRARRP